MSVAEERKDGTLKRLRGTPMPPAAYFIGKVGQVLAVSVVQAVVLIAVGVALMDLPLPHGVTPWATFAWLYAMGVTLATLLGIAASHTLKKGANGAAIALPFTALQFVSGVFIPFNELPSGAQQFSALFPLKWLCQGMRSVFLPDSFAAVEPAGAWELTRVALVLGVWIVIALVLCLKTFSWSGNEDK
jgi:ABC-2 type transport system permease protein